MCCPSNPSFCTAQFMWPLTRWRAATNILQRVSTAHFHWIKEVCGNRFQSNHVAGSMTYSCALHDDMLNKGCL